MTEKTGRTKIIAFDLLRIIAIVMVLFNHRHVYTIFMEKNIGSTLFFLEMIPSILCKCGPVLFLMVSGALLLGKNESFSYIFKHRIIRFFLVLIICTVWQTRKDFSPINIIYNLINNGNWYLYAYIAYLFMLPFLRKIAQNCSRNEMMLFILLSALFQEIGALFILLNQTMSLPKNFIIFSANWVSDCWQVVMPLTGYFINKMVRECDNEKDKLQKFLFTGTILSLLASMLFIYTDCRLNGGVNNEQLRQRFILMPASLIYYFFLKSENNYQTKFSSKVKSLIGILSKATFGIYLLEVYTNITPNISVILTSRIGLMGIWCTDIMTILFSLITMNVIIFLLRKIPFVSKLI